MNTEEIIKITKAQVIGNIKYFSDIKISTDTRTIKPGDLYLPLKGASFDGENFIQQALEKGACGAFCTAAPNIDGSFFLVKDTLEAYLRLANYRRNKQDFKVVAITGSSGKTTTKEIIASVLSTKYKTFKTPLNHNNEIGFCQTVFETPEDTQVLVLEMGMRGLGEIDLLSKYAEPDITVISNVGTAHIGRLGSRENIAKAKCEIVNHQRGNLFVAHNDEIIRKTVSFDGKKEFYSIKDVKFIKKEANYSKFEYKSSIFELNVGGDYNIENALAAIIIGLELELTLDEIKSGLKNYKPIEKRWETTFSGGYEIINDSYNANPESMKAFIDTVLELYSDYVLILGDMGELGKDEVFYHKNLGEYIYKKNSNARVISIGKLSENITTACNGKHFSNIEEAVNYIQNNINCSTKLFLKASRSMKFEKIIEKLN